MKEIIKYQAEDGTMFESKQACEDYEAKTAASGFNMYLYNGNETGLLCEAQYVITYGERGVELFKQFAIDDECSCENVNDIGLSSLKPTKCLFVFHDADDKNDTAFEPLVIDDKTINGLFTVLNTLREKEI